jgi:hypothetical protein
LSWQDQFAYLNGAVKAGFVGSVPSYNGTHHFPAKREPPAQRSRGICRRKVGGRDFNGLGRIVGAGVTGVPMTVPLCMVGPRNAAPTHATATTMTRMTRTRPKALNTAHHCWVQQTYPFQGLTENRWPWVLEIKDPSHSADTLTFWPAFVSPYQ